MVCLHGLCAVAVWVGPGVNSVNPAPQRDQVKAINRNGIIQSCSCDIFFICVFFSRMKLLLIGGISKKLSHFPDTTVGNIGHSNIG